jgi:glycerol-3-phosphate dehydrogenase
MRTQISDLIRNALEIDVSVLMGANVANEVSCSLLQTKTPVQMVEHCLPSNIFPHTESLSAPDVFCSVLFCFVLFGVFGVQVAKEDFCETTIGYKVQENGEILQKLFTAKMFRVNIVQVGRWVGSMRAGEQCGRCVGWQKTHP